MASLEAMLITLHRTYSQLRTTRVDNPQHEEELDRSEQQRLHIRRQETRLRHNSGTCLLRLRVHRRNPSSLHLPRLCLTLRSSVQRFGPRPSKSRVGRCRKKGWIERTRRLSSVQSLHADRLYRNRKTRLRKLDRSTRRLQRNRQANLMRWTSTQILHRL